MTDVAVNAARPETKEQRAWYWYDWANSTYVTTTATVLMGPYLTAVAKEAACPGIESGVACTTNLSVLGVPIAPGSVYAYTVTFSTILSAIVLIFIGAIADRSPHPTKLFARFAWAGALAACLMFFIAGTNWQLGVVLVVIATICLGASLVVYDSILCRIANENERDRVSSKGWALGYLGGGVLLALNFALMALHGSLGLSEGMAVRINLLSAGVWWGAFTLIPYLGLRHLTGTVATPVERQRGVVGGSLSQLASTFRELRLYPQTMLFLLAYLFFNDGIQTVIGNSSLYGQEELGFDQTTVLAVFLFVQFVAYFGARFFGAAAARVGAWRTVLGGIALWSVVVVAAFFVPARQLAIFVVLALLIGIVLGGTQALSRSLYSQLIPRGREAEFFSLYQAMERGTSWLGTLAFGLVYQFTHSYRWAIVVLIVFFIVGSILLSRVKMREGIEQAGNPLPVVV
ncbi:MAG: MFS transporter [Intrasporangium sp.]|uniref:MFS transporter n=1 Tax=Intrasporangium sp. TaxID=1925024 RepID=UPI003F81CD58